MQDYGAMVKKLAALAHSAGGLTEAQKRALKEYNEALAGSYRPIPDRGTPPGPSLMPEMWGPKMGGTGK
jgi:hypothetical protein